MNNHFDIAVIGLGAHGSAAIYHLSQTGCNVLGIDRFHPPHTWGSSHGQSRIIREAYLESPMYVPLIQTAYTMWEELEKAWGKPLLLKTGGLMLGKKESAVVAGSKLSADTYAIPYDYLDAAAIKQRFPAFKMQPDDVGLYEQRAGILFPEECIQAQLALAANNTTLQFDEQVQAIIPGDNSITITTNKATYTADKLIVSAGAWLNELLPELRLPLTVQRQVLFWFKNTSANNPLNEQLTPGKLPIYIWEYQPDKMFYGFPDLGDGIKIALHHQGAVTTADGIDREVSGAEIDAITAIIKQYLTAEVTFNYSVVCMYTNTPDEHFILDYHPQHRNIIVASPCSGHGFKFSSAIGKILSEMATGAALSNDIAAFGMSRFAAAV